MFIQLLAETIAKSPDTAQSIIGVIGTSITAGGAITVAVNRIFDANKIKIIVELQAEAKSLQRELVRRDSDIEKLEKENDSLKAELDTLRDNANSSLNMKLLEIQEENKRLANNYKKAVTIINKLKEGK